MGNRQDGKRLFERETFGGNGRTCSTCHTSGTGTISPEEAQRRFNANPMDPLFLHDGSDDGQGHGVSRMLASATILVTVPVPSNVSLADDPTARTVTLRRGIPSTINTPGLDPVLMLDGRQPSLQAQAMEAIADHAQATAFPTGADLDRLHDFPISDAFFSSPALREFARGGPAPRCRRGPRHQRNADAGSSKTFRRTRPISPEGLKDGLCSACHSGPLLNTANQFLQIVVPGAIPGTDSRRSACRK